MMFGPRIAAFLLGLLTLLSSPALAGSLRIAVPADGCPAPALLADLARAVAREAGLVPQVIQMPLADIPGALSRGTAGAALAPAAVAARAPAANLGAALTLHLVLVPRATTVLRAPRDLAAKTVALFRADPCLTARVRAWKAVPLPARTTGDALKLALAGQADAVIGWERAVTAALGRERFPARALGRSIDLGNYAPCLLVARRSGADRARLEDALRRLRLNGALAAVAARHLL